MLIRECTHQDLDQIFQLDAQWDQENITHHFEYYPRAEVVAYLERTPIYFFVAEDDGEVVGYINGSVHRDKEIVVIPKQEPYLEVDNIYVKPDFRGSGIGSELMKRLLDRAEQHGIRRYIVDSVSTEMDRIIAFYRSHGFKPWYVQLFK